MLPHENLEILLPIQIALLFVGQGLTKCDILIYKIFISVGMFFLQQPSSRNTLNDINYTFLLLSV